MLQDDIFIVIDFKQNFNIIFTFFHIFFSIFKLFLILSINTHHIESKAYFHKPISAKKNNLSYFINQQSVNRHLFKYKRLSFHIINVYCMNATFSSGSYIKPSKSTCKKFNKQFIF